MTSPHSVEDKGRVHFFPHGLDFTGAALLLAAGVLSGFINVVAGGGTLLAVPALIFLGLPETTANGTVRLGILAQNIAAISRYSKAGAIPWEEVRRWVPPVLCGGLAGAIAGTHLSNDGFRLVFGTTMLVIAVLIAIRPSLPALRRNPDLPLPAIIPLGGLALAGFYGGFIQAGSGYLFLGVGVLLLNLPLGRANILKVAFVTSYTPVALAIFAMEDQVNLQWGLLLAIGQAAGGWLGAVTALKRGEGFIRGVLLVVVFLSALKLLIDT